MKRYIFHLILFFLFISKNVNAQPNWRKLPFLVNNGRVMAMTSDRYGYLYVAGNLCNYLIYNSICSVNNVYKWDGVTWSLLGGNSNGLNANNTILTLATDSFGNIYAAGQFTDSTNMYKGHHYVAKWDGISWSKVANGNNELNANNIIRTIAIDKNNNIYAAGRFTDSTKNYKGHKYVAKWNGFTWNEIGVGSNKLKANNEISKIVIDSSGSIYCVGSFTDSILSNKGKSYIAKWDGSMWSNFGYDSIFKKYGSIDLIAIGSDNKIYINSRQFYNIYKSLNRMSIMYWNDSAWVNVGSGIPTSYVGNGFYSIAFDKQNNIYVSGLIKDDTINNSLAPCYVAKWNGIKWLNGGNYLSINSSIINVNRNYDDLIYDHVNNKLYGGTGLYNDSCNYHVAVYDGVNRVEQVICNTDSFMFGTKYLKTSGIYTDTLLDMVGQDSIVQLNLLVANPTHYSYTQNICIGSSFNFNGNNLTTAGIYFDTLQNYLGCDSFITLHLNVNQPSSKTLNQTICNNQTYHLNGTILTQSGTYYDTIQNHFGCDSFITLHLIVNPITSYSFNKTICSNQFYSFNHLLLNSTGIYFDTLINHNGCDSFITLHLTVLPASSSSFTKTICSNNPFLLNGHLLNSTGKYYDTLTNYLGCDSVIILRLTVLPSFNYNSTTLTFCEGSPYFYNGHVYTTNTQLYDTFKTQLGCDSIVGIKIITIPAPDTSVIQSSNLLIAQAQHSSFYWYDCMQHQLIQNSNDDTLKINHSGTYAVIVKDSLTLCSDTSNCRTIVVSGIEEQLAVNSNQLTVFPNPVGSQLTVSSNQFAVNTIEITDVLGRTQIVQHAHLDSDVLAVYSPLKRGQGGLEIDTENLPSGIYFIKATDAKGNVWNGKFVKE